MEPIQGKTKIKKWIVSDGAETIAFERFDFSPRQVGSIERVLRHPDDVVKLTIEPEQDKLKIKPIECHAHMGPMDCRQGGQLLTIAKFTSPPDRADSLKALAMAVTALLVTIEETQMEQPLFDKDADADAPAAPVPFADDQPGEPEVVDIKMNRNWSAACRITLSGDDEAGYCVTAAVKIPTGDRILRGPVQEEGQTYETKRMAMQAIRPEITTWFIGQAAYPHAKAVIKKVETMIGAWITKHPVESPEGAE